MLPNTNQRSISHSESKPTREQLDIYKREESENLANVLVSTRAVSAKEKEQWGNRVKWGVIFGVLLLFALFCSLPSLSSFNGDTTNTPPSVDDDTANTPPANVIIDTSKTGENYTRREFGVHVKEGEIPRKRIVEIYWNVYEAYDFDNF